MPEQPKPTTRTVLKELGSLVVSIVWFLGMPFILSLPMPFGFVLLLCAVYSLLTIAGITAMRHFNKGNELPSDINKWQNPQSQLRLKLIIGVGWVLSIPVIIWLGILNEESISILVTRSLVLTVVFANMILLFCSGRFNRDSVASFLFSWWNFFMVLVFLYLTGL